MGRKLLGAAALALAALGACAPPVRFHGYVPSDSALAGLAVGVDTREDVIAAVGRPTAGGVLGDTGFYYVQSEFRQLAFLEPREVGREVLAISFAPDGTIGNIERFGLEDGRVVPLSTRVTEGVFADRAFVAQILGNIGRFDATRLFDDEDE